MKDDPNSADYSIWNTRIDPDHKLTKEEVQHALKSTDKKNQTNKRRP